MAESKEANSDRQDDSLMEAGKVPKLHNGFTDSLNVRSDSLLNRIGRLDATVAIMEKTSPSELSEPLNSPSKTSPQLKHVSSPLNTPFGLDERRKPTEFVLEEVQKRGTLVERVSDLENRVMQLQRVFSARWSESAQQLSMVHDSSCSPWMESNDECSHQMLKDLNLEKQDCNFSHASSLKGHVEAVKDFGNHDPNEIKLKELCLDSYTVKSHLCITFCVYFALITLNLFVAFCIFIFEVCLLH
ncbi:hypothetical protein KP509_04G038300 [Ceratopteris richardii]|uniref:Uncharacterized protein n=1 Tax=Ceratopteris richardii TaxID=49495 RepID=A0A8T2UZQ0_CERRI|nr:hypothetical protein KP509_04G038300 [Ceratopteris richardii]